MLIIDSLTVTKIVHAGQAWAQKLQNHIYCCTFELFISMCLILTSWMWIKTIFLEMFWKGVVKKNCGGFSFYGSWIFTRWNSWWPDTSWEFCLFTNIILLPSLTPEEIKWSHCLLLSCIFRVLLTTELWICVSKEWI